VASLALAVATPTAALGIGILVAVGGVAAFGASRVPPPQAERLGLRGLGPSHLLAVALLLPSFLLVSEVDNWVRALAPPPDAPVLAERARERIATETPLALVETLIVVSGLVPIAEEWLFRGVIQQGLVARLGAAGGVAATAALFAAGHGSPGISAAAWLAAAAANFGTGIMLGVARLATGSLLAPILLHAGMNGLGTASIALQERVPIPGLNAPGAHTPLALLLPAAAAVTLGFVLLRRPARAAPDSASRPDPGSEA
jgi:membrane protease YdiL (CAAX protease family)